MVEISKKRERNKKITFNADFRDLENIDLIKEQMNAVAGGKINTSIAISIALSYYADTYRKEEK